MFHFLKLLVIVVFIVMYLLTTSMIFVLKIYFFISLFSLKMACIDKKI